MVVYVVFLAPILIQEFLFVAVVASIAITITITIATNIAVVEI